MEYKLSLEQFRNGKMFNSKGKFIHNSGYRFKMFPFKSNNRNTVLELRPLVGGYLCKLAGHKPKLVQVEELVDQLKAETEIEPGREEFFGGIIRQLFFETNERIRPLNLQFLERIPCSSIDESKIAEYLVDVLGDKIANKNVLEKAREQTLKNNNVLENAVLSKMQYEADIEIGQDIPYFSVTNALKTVFEEDFAYILEMPKQSTEYMVDLLEFYFFSYTAQTVLQLNKFMDGDREIITPLYFCLEWEKTSQGRLCYTDGWKKLQNAIKKMFAHVLVLEILNQTEAGSELVDYIKLSELISDDETDHKISGKIDMLTSCYRNEITDCPQMHELDKKITAQGATADSVRYLFDNVRVQFESTGRSKVYTSYSNEFEAYCHKYLKHRGRSGLVLNMSEELLIFITKLCIKNEEQMRLKDVFKAFERRAIFLDNISREHVANYYEKLNLIEKKSDSGDAKYVKRIL